MLFVVGLVVVLVAGDVGGEQVQERLRVVAGPSAGEHARGLGGLQGEDVGRVVGQLAGAAACDEVDERN